MYIEKKQYKGSLEGVSVIKEDDDNYGEDFNQFICDVYNKTELDSIFLTDLQSMGNSCAGYYILISDSERGFTSIWIDPYDLRKFEEDGRTFLPYWDAVFTQEEIYSILEYGEIKQHAQLIEVGDGKYEFNYGDDTSGYESEPLEGDIKDVIWHIERKGWDLVKGTADDWCDYVFRLYQQDGCIAVFTR